ncbi:MAG: sodium-dependent bicarbonate transport family permease [Trueperaceae bacterium]
MQHGHDDAEAEQEWPDGEVLAGRSIVLLAGGLLIGAAAGPTSMARVEPFFVAPFEGVLTLFLLEMGLVTGRRLGELRAIGPFLLGFGIVMPVLHGLLGVALGPLVGLSLGGTTVLAVLFASASYIAATAAVRLGLPEANPSLYLTASLAITFPFNLVIGIPLFARATQALWGSGP